LQENDAAMDSVGTWREDFVLWGGREGVETDAVPPSDVAVKRLREALTIYASTQGSGLRLQVSR